jgi:hypothetical protein
MIVRPVTSPYRPSFNSISASHRAVTATHIATDRFHGESLGTCHGWSNHNSLNLIVD